MSAHPKPCPTCRGEGGEEHEKDFGGRHPVIRWFPCKDCNGTGKAVERAA